VSERGSFEADECCASGSCEVCEPWRHSDLLSDVEPAVMHRLDAYTWAGRRATCALTSEWLRCSKVEAEVTCPRCLAALANGRPEVNDA
jgi:hypothetical protein